MKRQLPDSVTKRDAEQFCDVLILPDGKVLAHALTPVFARLLRELNPQDSHFLARQTAADGPSRLPPPASLPHELCPGN